MAFVAYSTGSSSITLMGDVHTDEHSEPKIIPNYRIALSFLSWRLSPWCPHRRGTTAYMGTVLYGPYCHGALGLGVPTDLPLGTPGGYLAEAQLFRSRLSEWGPLEPPKVTSPSPVHFNHGEKPGGRRFCFAATAAGWHTGALVVCLEVSPPHQIAIRYF